MGGKVGLLFHDPWRGGENSGLIKHHMTTDYNQSMGNPCSSMLEDHNEKLFDLGLAIVVI